MPVAFVRLDGSAASTSSSTTLAIPTSATGIPVGSFVVIRVAADNLNATTPTFTASDTSSNTWTTHVQGAVNATGAAGVAGAIICSKITTTISATTNITVTLSGAVAHKAAYLEIFTGVENTVRVAAVKATGTSTGGNSGSTTSGIQVGDLLLGATANETRATLTGSSGATGGAWLNSFQKPSATSGSDTTCVSVIGQYKITTASGGQQYTTTTTATEWLCMLVVLQASPEPSITQAAYRFYADGTESGSTALAAQDTAPTVDVTTDVNLGVRARLQATTAVAVPATDDFQLQWEKNASGTWSPVTNSPGEELADSYPTSNQNSAPGMSGSQVGFGQSFLGNGQYLTRAEWYLIRNSSADGTLTAYLYAHTGTFGTTGFPTGSALATSTSVAASSLAASLTVASFTFDGTFKMTAGTPYVITIEIAGISIGSVGVGTDTTSPTHAGSAASNLAGWGTYAGTDLIFAVYSQGIAGHVVPYDSSSLTEGAATTNRLGAGTGSFVAGKVSEDGLVDNLGWTASNYTEALYSITLKSADLANADTLRFRILKNAATTNMTYTQTPTINVTKTVIVPISVPTMAPRVPA